MIPPKGRAMKPAAKVVKDDKIASSGLSVGKKTPPNTIDAIVA